MRIKLIAVGTRMPDWVAKGYLEYAKRLAADVRLELVEVAPGHRGKSGDARQAMARESARMRAAIGSRDRVVALDVKGTCWSTGQLAEKLADWQMLGQDIALLVGGPDGLAPDCVALASQRWSLSALTFPHPLVRIIIAEQIYRAWTMLNNHPYHR